jgi:hypothetical protein
VSFSIFLHSDHSLYFSFHHTNHAYYISQWSTTALLFSLMAAILLSVSGYYA